MTSTPSFARFSATARMRESLSPSCSPLGSTDGLEWLSSTRSVPPSPTGIGKSSRSCSTRSSSRMPQRLPGEVADLGVVALALELRDHDDGKDHRVLGEAEQRPRIGQQHRGVEHVRPLGLCGARGRRGSGRILRPDDRPTDLEVSSEATTAPAPSVPLGSRAGRRSSHERFTSRLDRAPCPMPQTLRPRRRIRVSDTRAVICRSHSSGCRDARRSPDGSRTIGGAHRRVSTTRPCRTTRTRRAACRGSRRWSPRAR